MNVTGPTEPAPSAASAAGAPSARLLLLLVTVAWLGALGVRLSALPDVMEDDQEGPASSVMDVVQNGRWACQRNYHGEVASKPPLYTWLAALPTLALGRITRLTLSFPSWASALAAGWIVLAAGTKFCGAGAGFWGAFAYLVSMTALRQVTLARTDALFTLTVTVAALSAHRAWIRGAGWTWFWLAAAAATLTKGPLGALLALGGLLAAWWERRSGSPLPLRGSHAAGILLFVGLTAGWLALAWADAGRPVLRKMIGVELVGHALRSTSGHFPGEVFYRPFLYFLSRFVPWGFLACVGFWRVWKRPAKEAPERRFERFLFCFFWFGMAVFSIAPHQRADLLFPLLPASAILAGREMARWFRPRRPGRFAVGVAAALGAWFGFAGLYCHVVENARPKAVYTQWTKEFAAWIDARVGGDFPLTYVDAPYALQFYRNVLQRRASAAQAAAALAGPEPAFAVVRDAGALSGRGVAVIEVARWPLEGKPYLRILSNHPRLEATNRLAVAMGGLGLRMDGARLRRLRGEDFDFDAAAGRYGLLISNESPAPRRVGVRVDGSDPAFEQSRLLRPGEAWRIEGRRSPGFEPAPSRRGVLSWPRCAYVAAFGLPLAAALAAGARAVLRVIGRDAARDWLRGEDGAREAARPPTEPVV